MEDKKVQDNKAEQAPPVVESTPPPTVSSSQEATGKEVIPEFLIDEHIFHLFVKKAKSLGKTYLELIVELMREKVLIAEPAKTATPISPTPPIIPKSNPTSNSTLSINSAASPSETYSWQSATTSKEIDWKKIGNQISIAFIALIVIVLIIYIVTRILKNKKKKKAATEKVIEKTQTVAIPTPTPEPTKKEVLPEPEKPKLQEELDEAFQEVIDGMEERFKEQVKETEIDFNNLNLFG